MASRGKLEGSIQTQGQESNLVKQLQVMFLKSRGTKVQRPELWILILFNGWLKTTGRERA